ncbi:MAG TPA: FRG domain-containing protein [Bryobacteraceae bacterium]|jgi:hypothetical protein|nr:FRG domain-containing protein [Bryobacteraceae bacterium]
MTWPDEQPFASLQELTKCLEALIAEAEKTGARWIYRGQPRATYLLEPTIERRPPKEGTNVNESHLLWDYKRFAVALSDRAPAFNDNPSWLALMRHHGVPTRLLDWTDSCYVALFFACDEADRRNDDQDQESSLWALNATLMLQKMKEQLPSLIPDSAKWELDLSDPMQFDAVALHGFDNDANKD